MPGDGRAAPQNFAFSIAGAEYSNSDASNDAAGNATGAVTATTTGTTSFGRLQVWAGFETAGRERNCSDTRTDTQTDVQRGVGKPEQKRQSEQARRGHKNEYRDKQTESGRVLEI